MGAGRAIRGRYARADDPRVRGRTVTRAARRKRTSLALRFPPSDPCSCDTCRSYCERPGWWTVEEAARALEGGLGPRMTLEWYPGHGVGVLAPAVAGLEGWIAAAIPAGHACTFLTGGLCALHGTGFMPLECRFCHHERPGRGPECHSALAEDWRTPAGRRLAERWLRQYARRALSQRLDQDQAGVVRSPLVP